MMKIEKLSSDQQNLAFFQLIYLVISSHMLRWSGTLVCGSTQNFPSLAMSGIPIRLVLFISGILCDSGGTSCVLLLFWLQMLS